MEKVDAYQPVGPKDKTVPILRAFYAYLPENGRVNFLHHLHATIKITALNPKYFPASRKEDFIDNIASESAGPMRREARLKTECLARDGSRCVVTGFFDEDSLDAGSTSPSTYTECVHIIPFSLASWSMESEGYAKDII
ncbi:hypothetical protein PENCOP_c008G08317 [Penicillium coprophilum]|uniref:Uncharacterized protein n=1 Tax=Penicillium coprophilum TaxID=36646 RepID=A0A1V6UJ61_9EURO|nr:hypothetical protein PENCOP_c008G08317 [Penicillium coprophilum]